MNELIKKYWGYLLAGLLFLLGILTGASLNGSRSDRSKRAPRHPRSGDKQPHDVVGDLSERLDDFVEQREEIDREIRSVDNRESKIEPRADDFKRSENAARSSISKLRKIINKE